MSKIAVFGKPGSGKSTLGQHLCGVLQLPFYPLDSLLYRPDGQRYERPEYERLHQQLLSSERWLIDGLGPLDSFYQRLQAADTLIYIELPYWQSYWLVTKRLLKSLWEKPEGWPEGSSVWRGSLESYRYLKLSPQFWNAEFEQQLEKYRPDKKVYVIRSLAQLKRFVDNYQQGDYCEK